MQRVSGRNIFCLQNIVYQKHVTSLELNNSLEMQLSVYEGKEGANTVEYICPCARPEGVCRSEDIAPHTHIHGIGWRWVLSFTS